MVEENFHAEEFNRLFAGFFDDLYKIAWRICGREDIAEELAQEAFLRYYRRINKLPSGNEAKFWLIRVVKNLAFNYEKRKGREKEALRAMSAEPSRSSINDGERKVFEDASKEEIRKALLRIPYKLRVVLILKEFSGYHYAEIARILKISEGNVKIRVFRARAHLSGILKEGK